MQAKERKENRLEGHGYIDEDDDDSSTHCQYVFAAEREAGWMMRRRLSNQRRH